MLRFPVCGVLLAVGLVMAQTKPGKEGYCAGLPLFGPKGSLNTADLRVETKDLRVQVNARGPELHVRLEPDTRRAAMSNGAMDDKLHRVGWVRVYSCDTGALIQSLEVQSMCGPECFVRWFDVKDVNFDGYADIAVLRDHAALWGSQTWWVFSPASDKFISNDFTKELSRISGNGLELDASRHNITVPNLFGPGRCSRAKDIYEVEQGSHLVLIHKENLTPRWNPDHTRSAGCTLTTLDRVNGEMKVTKVEHFDEAAN
jgi:hypothetical protein